jgi:hypothetical protein
MKNQYTNIKKIATNLLDSFIFQMQQTGMN